MLEFHMEVAGSKYFTLCSPLEYLSNKSLFWHTDNFAASKIVASSKTQTQNKSPKKRFSCLQMKIINPQNTIALVQRVMGKLTECDYNIGKFYL